VAYRRVPHWHPQARCRTGPSAGAMVEEYDRMFVDTSVWILATPSQWLPLKYLVLVTRDEDPHFRASNEVKQGASTPENHAVKRCLYLQPPCVTPNAAKRP
jgi:hypothetical protein